MTLIMKGGPVRLIIFIVLIGLACLDLGLVTFGDTTLSISAWLTYVGLRAPFVCIVIGMIIGHLFPMGLKKPSGRRVWIHTGQWEYYTMKNPANAYPEKPGIDVYDWSEFVEVEK